MTEGESLKMWTRYLLLVLLLLMSACNDEHGKRVVDFSDTVPVDRPGAKVAEHDSLRVAVGAMVSPKETMSYYQQLIDLMGASTGQKGRTGSEEDVQRDK